MYTVLVAAMALHGVHYLGSSGTVDTLLPTDIGDTVWTVSCDGTFEVQYLNDFGGDFIISNNGNEESRVSGEHKTLTTKSFAAHTNVTMTAHVKWGSGNKKVLFSWACDAVPAALPSTLNTAGNVSHLNYGPNEEVFWELQCAEAVRITWSSFDIGNDELRWRSGNDAEETIRASPGSNIPETFTIASTKYTTYVMFVFTSNDESEHGDFSFRYECVANSTDNDTPSPSAPHVGAGLVDTLLPYDIGDTVWTVSCDGTFTVQYLNDFGGDFIISNNGNEESRVSGEHKTLSTKSFAAHTNVTMTAHMKWSGNKKVLFSWACDAVLAALPSTLNTAGNVSHLNYGPNEKVFWMLQCAEDVRITWTSFDIGNDDVWVWQRENAVKTTKFYSSGSNIPEPLWFASTGYTYVTFTSNAASEHGGFAFRYECVANINGDHLRSTTPPSAPSDSAPKWWVWVLLAVGGVLLLGSAAFAAYHFCAPQQKSIPDSPHYTAHWEDKKVNMFLFKNVEMTLDQTSSFD